MNIFLLKPGSENIAIRPAQRDTKFHFPVILSEAKNLAFAF